MAWIKFEQQSLAKLAVRKTGAVWIGTTSVRQYGLRPGQLILLYDKDKKAVAFRPAKDGEDGSVKMSAKSGLCHFSCKSFFDFFEIVSWEGTYILQHDEPEGLYFFHLSKRIDNPRAKGKSVTK